MRAEATLPASARADAPPSDERPVFAAADGRRARRLRVAALVAAALVAAWVVALAAGMLGFGRLPGVPDLTSKPPDSHRAMPNEWTRTAPGGGPASLLATPAPHRAPTFGALRSPASRPVVRALRPAARSPRRAATRPATRRTSAGTQGVVPSSGAPSTGPGRRVGQSTTAPTTSARPTTPPGQERKAATTTGSGSVATPGHGQGATRTTPATG
jgi:hypothetical protein